MTDILNKHLKHHERRY